VIRAAGPRLQAGGRAARRQLILHNGHHMNTFDSDRRFVTQRGLTFASRSAASFGADGPGTADHEHAA